MRLARSALLFTSLSIALVGAACKRPEKQEVVKPAADTASSTQAVATRFAKLTEKKVSPTLEVSGSLVADETSEVATAGSGVVVEVAVDVGSRVKKGDLLVRLDQRDPSLRLSAASAQAEQARARLGIKPGEKFDAKNVAEVRAAKEAMDLAVTDADRTKALFESGSVSQATWDQARSRAEQARAQYESALNGANQAFSGLVAADSQANLARKSVGDSMILAPFDGAVAEKRISVGEYANMGRVVAVVVRDRPLRLRVDVAETDAGKVAVGKEVTLTVAAWPGRVFKGVIKRVGASLKAQSRALPVEAEIPNDDGALKPGFFARAQVDLGGAEAPAFFVPRAAIGNSGSASRIFVRSGSRVVEKIVTIGRELDGLVEIRGAIAPTDEVAMEAVDQLSDGVEVKVLQ